ncbi:MAG: serine/threonine-protein kinase [Deltaproteobacteria bacterium]
MGGPIAWGDLYLLEQLGVGSQGDVWLATRGDGRPVVVKRAGSAVAEHPRLRLRFLHEASIAQAIDHPNVVRIESAAEHDGQPYLVMDYIDGLSVRQLVALHRTIGDPFEVAAAIDITCDALAGVHALHTARDDEGTPLAIVHRDIAPKNLMFDRRGVTQLIDFGIGRSTRQTWRTATGLILGSPGYMSPEQALGERVDTRSDVFALGTVCFELLTMQRYIPGKKIAEILAATTEPVWRKPSVLRPEIPEAIDECLQRALAIDPDARYPSADAFRRALREAVTFAPGEGAQRLLRGLDWAEATLAHTRVLEQVEAARQLRPPSQVLVRESRTPLLSVRSISAAIVFGVVVATTAVFTVERGQQPEPTSAITPPAPAPRVEATPTALPRAESDPEQAEPETDAAPAPRRIRRARRRVRTTKVEATPPPTAPAVADTPTLEALVRRTRALVDTSTADDDRQAALDLLFELNRLGAEAQRGQEVDLREVSRRVARLERRKS